MKQTIKRIGPFIKSIVYRWSPKVFCISMQRTGTTSVGRFFRDFGYRWAGWTADENNDWSTSWYEGDYKKIFSSIDFRAANAYEDSPWFLPGFYKILFHRFPKSKFVLWTRDPDAWFKSMVSLNGGDIIGRTRNHCKIYRREKEFFDLLETNGFDETAENEVHSKKTMKLDKMAEHYKQLYQLHTVEVKDFFKRHSSASLHVGTLEDPEKWVKLGKFLGINVPRDYESRENVS